MNDKVPNYDITIRAGGDYAIDFSYERDDGGVISMSGWTVKAQLRDFPQEYYAYDFTCSADSSGIHLTMGHAVTSKISFSQGCYDVFITAPDQSVRDKLIKGMAEIIPEVSR